MEFQDFWKERDRMCEQYEYCQLPRFGEGCPMKKLFPNNNFSCLEVVKMYSVEAEQIVKQWAKEHPIVTNGIKLNEIFGEGFKMSARDTLDMRVTFNGEDVSFLEWLKQEYQPPKGEE